MRDDTARPDTASSLAAITIRQASLGDAGELARLRWDFSPDEAASMSQSQSPAQFAQAFASWLSDALSTGCWTIWVAERDGRLIGNVYVQAIAKVPRPGRFGARYGYVTNVYVEPDFRNQGIGTRLLGAAVEHSREEKLEFLILWPSEESVEFYRRAGFAPSPEALEVHLSTD